MRSIQRSLCFGSAALLVGGLSATPAAAVVDDGERIDGRRIVLTDASAKKKGDEVDVEVGHKAYTGLGVGDTFASYFMVNGIAFYRHRSCADFEYERQGSAQAFRLCIRD